MLPLPAIAMGCLIWTQWFGGEGVTSLLASGFNASLDLLFVLAGWRTALLVRSEGKVDGKQLLRRGALRFLPMHLVLMALAVACALVFRAQGYSRIGSVPFIDGLSLVANLFLVHGWFPAGMFLNFWNPHLWIFGTGLLWLQVAPLVVRALERAVGRGASALGLALALWSLAFLGTLVAWRWVPLEVFDVNGRLWFFLMLPPVRLWEFGFGVLLRLAMESPLRRGGVRDRLESKRMRWTLVPAILGLVALFAGLSVDLLGGNLGWIVSQPLLVAPLWGLLLVILAKEPSTVPAWMEEVGWASVPVLMFSPWAFWCAVALTQSGWGVGLPITAVLVNLLVGLVVHWGILRPVRKWCDRRWPKD